MHVCENYIELISALIDDELSAAQRLEVLEHIANCPACKAYWEELLQLRDVLRSPVEQAPVGFSAAVMEKVRKTAQDPVAVPKKKTLLFPGWKRFASLAACCAVLAIGVLAMDLVPGLTGGSTSDCAVRNSAAPQTEAMDNGMHQDAAENYSVNNPDGKESPETDMDTNGAACIAPPEDDAAMEDAGAYGGDSEADFVLSTGSAVARQWVEDHLGEAWVAGKCYVLSDEQYHELVKLLTEYGESFQEITGNDNGGSYQLLAE